MKAKMKKLDLIQMERRCAMPTAQFKREPGFQVFSSKTGVHLFKDNGADILAVAHLDTVQSTDHFYELFVGGQRWVLNPKLDDRLGVYVILDYLPLYGLNYDILLTEGEETGRSTAGDFVPPEGKQYNWMFQFDRMGEDVVMYDYSCIELRGYLERHTFKVGIGSFSDICKLEELGCKGFNVGVGYENYHSLWAIANLAILKRQILRFLSFYVEMHGIRLPHEKRVWSGRQYTGYGEEWGEWDAATKSYKRGGNHHKKHRWEGNKLVEDKSVQTQKSIEDTQPIVQAESEKTTEIEIDPKTKLYKCPSCHKPVQSISWYRGMWLCRECLMDSVDRVEPESESGHSYRVGVCAACNGEELLLEFFHGSWYCQDCFAFAKRVIEQGDIHPPEV